MKSLWLENINFTKRNSLHKDIKCDVLVIGSGMAGILTAYLLKQSGIDVVVIEAKETASGNTSRTTAKITSQHDLIYNKLIKEFGEEYAQQYASANELAIKQYSEIVSENNIDCDFQSIASYIYSLDDISELEKELDAARKLGIDAEIVDVKDIPLDVRAALRFNNQAQFNPMKFLSEISKELTIYEHTMAVDIKENIVTTNRGEIKANHIVVATHFPFINVPGYYFLRMHQERSYILALENAQDVDGMYIDENKQGYSFRNYKKLLLFGGMSHRTGKNENESSIDKLKQIAKNMYPNSKVKYSWSAQDCMTIDGIPYIGRYSLSTPSIYVATGFNKWGMSSSMVSAMIITDLILGRENNNADIFSPTRFDLTLSTKNLIKDGFETTKNFIAQGINIPDENIKHIQKGCGGIVEYNGDKVGVYKDTNGRSYIVTTKCPHLGCELKWNLDELSWDCPCHGSRFNYKGEWIESPATRGLT